MDRMTIANLFLLGIGALMFYGLTRAQPWGTKLALGCFVALVLFMVAQPDDGCHTDWDGRSNPTVCD